MKVVCDKSVLDATRAFGDTTDVDLVLLPSTEITPDTLMGADALITRSTIRVDASLLSRHTPGFIATATVGTDHVDLDLLRERGVTFVSAAGSSAASVAQFTWGVIAILAARLEKPLNTIRLGVVGCGAIGEKVARGGEELAGTVTRIDPFLRQADPDRYAEQSAIADCDVVSFHVPLTPDGPHPTENMVDRTFLAQLPHGAMLINTARGRIIDQEAVIEAVENGSLGALALDVFPGEPAPLPELLRACTLATPHIAGRSQEGMMANTRVIERAFRAHFGLSPASPCPDLSEPGASLTAMDAAGLVHEAWQLLGDQHRQLCDSSWTEEEARAATFRGLRKPPLRRDLDAWPLDDSCGMSARRFQGVLRSL